MSDQNYIPITKSENKDLEVKDGDDYPNKEDDELEGQKKDEIDLLCGMDF